MIYHRSCRSGVALILLMMLLPLEARAASAPYKIIYTFGGLNERSGILWVARDAGIFQKYGIDPTIVNVRNAQVGMEPDQIRPAVERAIKVIKQEKRPALVDVYMQMV